MSWVSYLSFNFIIVYILMDFNRCMLYFYIMELYELAEDIRYACETCEISFENASIHFTISIGCCYQEQPASTLKELFNEADQRLYIAKRNGKNYVQM